MKIRKGDNVQIFSGKDRGKRGKVIESQPAKGRLVIEGLNMRKKHVRARQGGQKGQIAEYPAPLPVARVMLVCPSCQKAIRVGVRKLDNGRQERYCRKCSAAIATAKVKS